LSGRPGASPRSAARFLASGVAAFALLLTGAAVRGSVGHGAVYRDGPPPGFSGGFGEASCQACHFSGELNEAPGQLSITGPPGRYRTGETYPMVLELARPGMVLGGFELTARFAADGGQAGELRVHPDDEGRVGLGTDRGVQYAFQVGAGSEPTGDGSNRWTILWSAPSSSGGEVVFHAAANAADGDDTAEGDYVYTASVAARPSAD
jgi:hypothetical protein